MDLNVEYAVAEYLDATRALDLPTDRVPQLADEGQLAANTYFVTGPGCAPVPGLIRRDKFARCSNLPGILVDLVQREKV